MLYFLLSFKLYKNGAVLYSAPRLYIFSFIGFKISASFFAANSSADLIACAYILLVVDGVACPRRFATVLIFVPPAIRSVAFVCPYGIIKTNGESRIKSRVLRFILIYFSSFSNPKFTRFSSLITVMLS